MATGGSYRNRDRSRSPVSSKSVGHRRDIKIKKEKDITMSSNMGMANMPMMMNNMYQQANMMMPNAMAGGMPNAMAGGIPNAMAGMAGGIPNAMAAGMPNAIAGAMPNPMAGGMYPNIMMQGSMIGTGMMPTSGVDMMTQQTMEISSMGSDSSTPNIDIDNMNMNNINMMGGMGGMMMDPSMMGSMGMGNMQMFHNMAGEMPRVPKEEIILKNCKLTPGNTDPPLRTRPPGCRTIFVGGWPEKIRESIIREIFERYGRIHTLRHSKKNFCHIRFDRETSVDAAMLISGYKVKLMDKESKEEEEEETPANSGWLHVDYALSRDDQNDYDRRQRQVLRLQQQQMEALTAQQQLLGGVEGGGGGGGAAGLGGHIRQRSPSPKIQPFSNNNILQLIERIKNEEYFSVTLPTLLAWLERGECSKKNSNQFYSMIQATNSHIRRLYNEKMQSEEELQEARERVKQNIAKVIDQLEQVAKVFVAATHQRVWDHFTKPQRKNIESWQRMTQEFSILREEFNEKFNNEDKDNNDFGNTQNTNLFNNYNMDGSSDSPDMQSLKLENDSLRFQLEAYKNEVDVIKSDAKSEMEKFKAQFIARQALQGAFEKNPPLPSPVEKPPPPPPLPDDVEQEDSKVELKEEVDAGSGEAKLIGIMSAFLQVHPQGASLDYVVSYVRGVTSPAPAPPAVLRVLHRHPAVFQRATTGVGANIEHRWNFVAFTSKDLPTNGTSDEN